MMSSATQSCSSTASNNKQQNVTAASAVVASSPTNSIKNIKCEPYSSLSPCNESTNSQADESSNNGNNNNNNNSATNTAIESLRERDIGNSGSSGITVAAGGATTKMLRQSSNSSINSCPATATLSPNNGSDHSNSSNISNLSQVVDGNSVDMLQDIKIEKANDKKQNNFSTNLKDCDDKISCTGNTKNSLCASVKEELDGINNLSNVKKEENSDSPNVSPVGFGSIGNATNSIGENAGRALTPVKLNEMSSSAKNSNKSSEKGSGSNTNCADDAGSTLSNLNNNETCGGGSAHHTPTSVNNFHNNSTGGNGSGNISHGNSMDYMQQQNHIFVFSTQLANKGAEAVLSGQFPTIIAYHCTQPATKSFLEDFFMKNPMKMSKVQRQNSLNMCGISVSANGQQWLSGCNNMAKLAQQQQQQQQKKGGGKMNFTSLNSNIENNNKTQLHPPNIGGFSESCADALPSEDLMCWEQSRGNLDGPNIAETHTMKMLDNVESVNNARQQNTPSKSTGSADASADSSIPSLQGVKVPDENLTPQQRQHREEQLAKLKKMNQFLFPENGSEFKLDTTATSAPGRIQGPHQMGSKLPADNVAGNLTGIMLNMPGSGNNNSGGPQIGNTLRNIPSSIINQSKSSITHSENLPAGLGDDGMVPADLMGSAHDMVSLQCNANKTTCGSNVPGMGQTSLPCGPGNGGGSISLNSIACHGGINGPSGGMMPNSPEVISGFNQNCGNSSGGPNKLLTGTNMHSQDLNHVGMAQVEWSKLQHQFYEERVKGNKLSGEMPCGPAAMCRSNSTGVAVNVRQNLPGNQCITTGTAAANNHSGRQGPTQGPPPPYHPTQRSASVPIATQSPNPTSPNNPTSNLSLPSPRTAGVPLGVPTNSPNMDIHISTMPATTSTSSVVTTTASAINTISNANVQAKNSYQQEGSPNGANTNRNRSINQLNSNPSTPLSHMSPKDLESFSTTTSSGEIKANRRSPQRSKTPLINSSNNGSNIADTNIEGGRFPAASPVLNFATHLHNTSTSGGYKALCPMERQNSAPASSQFGRRTDNLPLNPNSSRPTQNKLGHSFDPITSLAQMSQQLTSCVPLNTSGGGGISFGGINNSPGGGMGVIGVSDLNMSNNVNQNIEGLMSTLDSNMDHCSPGASSNMGMPPHMSVGGGPGPGQFASNNCHINPMVGPMGPRLVNPKMCGGFNANNSVMREGSGNFHGGHRMMGRMPVNFGNFNVSPNIQVKASTPNTIQYMPVRPQNNNSNMRVPPSLEFLHRYANPQMGGGATNIIENVHLGGQINPNTDPNKISNHIINESGGGSAMNFFQNCNQMSGINSESEEMPGGMLSSHEINMGAHASMIRGMRPMRHHNLVHGPGASPVPGARMQTPHGNAVGPQFPISSQDSMECSDSAAIFGPGGNGPSPSQLYGGPHQKSVKSIAGINHNLSPVGNARNQAQLLNSSHLQNEQNHAMHSPVNGTVLLGSNSNPMQSNMAIGNNASPVGCNSGSGNSGGGSGNDGNVNFKAFLGPSSNDLKYAQQYHSFQQQLYATSTRSQQGGGGGVPNIGANLGPNSSFFVNK